MFRHDHKRRLQRQQPLHLGAPGKRIAGLHRSAAQAHKWEAAGVVQTLIGHIARVDDNARGRDGLGRGRLGGDHSGLVLQKFMAKARFATIGRRENRGGRGCVAISLAGCAAVASHARRVVSITRAAFADIARCARLESGVVWVMWTSCRPKHCNCESFSFTRENFGARNEEGNEAERRYGADWPRRPDRKRWSNASDLGSAENGGAAAREGGLRDHHEKNVQEAIFTSPGNAHAAKNLRNTPDEYAPPSACRNSRNDSGASASAVSGTVRTIAHRTPCSKHTCASAAPSISTASASGNAARRAFTSS